MKNGEYAFLKLQETVDDMSQALTGLAKSLNKSKKMVEVIKASKQASEFKEDCDQMTAAYEAKNKEYEALLVHRNLLKDLNARYKAADEHDKAIYEDALLTVFVSFNVIKDDELDK